MPGRAALQRLLVLTLVAGLAPVAASATAQAAAPPSPPTVTTVLSSGFDHITGVAVDPVTGDPVVMSDNTVVRVHGTGAAATLIRMAGDPAAPAGSGNGGPATAAGIQPKEIAYAPNGVLYIEDSSGRVRSVGLDGIIRITAGGGGQAIDDGMGATAVDLSTGPMAADASTLYISQSNGGGTGYSVYALDLAAGTWHRYAGGGALATGPGVAATSALLPQVGGLAVRPSDGALLVGSDQIWSVVAGALVAVPSRSGAEFAPVGVDAAGSVYTLIEGSGTFTFTQLWKSPSDGSAPLLMLGTAGAVTVGHAVTLADQMAVSADGTVYVVDPTTTKPSLLAVTATTGPWPAAAPTLSVAAPLSADGPFRLTVTAPAGAVAWYFVIVAKRGATAAASPADGGWVTEDQLTSANPVLELGTQLAGPCANGGTCLSPFVPGAPYVFTLFAYPDGSPASVPPVSVSAADPAVGGDAFDAVAPTRILDTRTGLGATGGRAGRVGAQKFVHLHVWGVGGVPTGAEAVVLNVTAVAPTASTFVSVYPGDQQPPTASNLNVAAGRIVPNLVTVKVSPFGDVNLYNAAGTVDLLADVTGYYSPDAATGFTPMTPVRALDTRTGLGAVKAPIGAGHSIDLQVAGANGVPAGATAVVMNVTATGPTAATFVQAYPTPVGAGVPATSNLNVAARQTVSNLVVVGIGAGGTVRLRNGAGTVNLVADVAGYFSTDPSSSLYVPVSPVRLLDTRIGQGEALGQGGSLGPGGLVDLQLTLGSYVPSVATAVAFNLAAVSPSTSTYVQAFPTPASGTAFPTASNVNVAAGRTQSGLVLASVGAGTRVRLRNAVGSVALVADLAGYYVGQTPVDHGAAPPAPGVQGVTVSATMDDTTPPRGSSVIVNVTTVPGATVQVVAHFRTGAVTASGVANGVGLAFVLVPVGAAAAGVAVPVTVTATSATLGASASTTTGFAPS